MTVNGWLQIGLYALVILALTKPLGLYMFRVFEGERQPLPRVFGPVERLVYRLCGVDPKKEQTWKEYAAAMLLFSLVSLLVTYAIERLQHVLPFNPQKLAAVSSRSRLQHRRQLHHQHQLAELRRREHDELPHADGGARVAQLHARRRRASGSRWRWRAASRASLARAVPGRWGTSGST